MLKSGYFFALALLFFLPLSAGAQTYQIDPAQSKVEWVGKKVTGQHNGTIQVKSGTVTLDNGKITQGQFVIDMSSLKVLDLQDPAANQKLTGHLKSDDFFSVTSFPESNFKITSAKSTGTNAAELTGDLTIKGKTHPLTIPVTLTLTGDQAAAVGQTKIDRTKYDVRYGSGKFFQNLGDKMIDDEFELKLNLVAKKQS